MYDSGRTGSETRSGARSETHHAATEAATKVYRLVRPVAGPRRPRHPQRHTRCEPLYSSRVIRVRLPELIEESASRSRRPRRPTGRPCTSKMSLKSSTRKSLVCSSASSLGESNIQTHAEPLVTAATSRPRPLRIDLADRLLLARLSLSPSNMNDDDFEMATVLASLPANETAFEYLGGCWRRERAERFKVVAKKVTRSPT